MQRRPAPKRPRKYPRLLRHRSPPAPPGFESATHPWVVRVGADAGARRFFWSAMYIEAGLLGPRVRTILGGCSPGADVAENGPPKESISHNRGGNRQIRQSSPQLGRRRVATYMRRTRCTNLAPGPRSSARTVALGTLAAACCTARAGRARIVGAFRTPISFSLEKKPGLWALYYI